MPNSLISTRWVQAVLSVSLICGFTQAAPPTLTHLTPGGGQRGTKVQVQCHGTFPWPVSIFSPGVKATPEKEAGRITLDLPKDLPCDRIWIRLHNQEGVSNLVPFLIGNLPEIQEVEPNDTRKNAQTLRDLPVTVNGVLSRSEVDCFSVVLKAGSSLIASLEAHNRLGSPMDAILQITSERGVVLAENHDDVDLDPLLVFRVPADGICQVKVFAFPSKPDSSIRFAGGPEFVYRLTLTTGGKVSHAFPLAVSAGTTAKVTLKGWNLPELCEASPENGTAAGAFGEMDPFGGNLSRFASGWGLVQDPRYHGSGKVRRLSLETPVWDPRDPARNGPRKVPFALSGCLAQPKEVHEHRIQVTKGQKLKIDLEARGLGFPMDPVMKILDGQGKVLSLVDDSQGGRDVQTRLTAPAEGELRILVADRFHQGGFRHCYLLTIVEDQPDFALELPNDAWVGEVGQFLEIPVTVVRSPGQKVGPITLEIRGLPPGMEAKPVVSESAGPTASKVTIKLPVAKEPFSGPVRVVGKMNEGTPLERVALTQPRFGARFDWGWLTLKTAKSK